MTAIAGFVQGAHVYMGCDSAITAGDIRCRTTEPKIWRQGNILIGAAGDGRCIQLIRNYWKPLPTHDLFDFIIQEGVVELQSILKAHRAPTVGEVELLIATKSRLVSVDPWWHVMERPDKIDAVGSGGQVALASLLTSSNKTAPKIRLRKALEISASLVNSVEGPFLLEKI